MKDVKNYTEVKIVEEGEKSVTDKKNSWLCDKLIYAEEKSNANNPCPKIGKCFGAAHTFCRLNAKRMFSSTVLIITHYVI